MLADVVKIVHVTSVVQLKFYETTSLVFVRKENKITTILLIYIITESTMTHARAAADIELEPCLLAEEYTSMRRGTVNKNGCCLCAPKVFSKLCKITVEPLMSHGF